MDTRHSESESVDNYQPTRQRACICPSRLVDLELDMIQTGNNCACIAEKYGENSEQAHHATILHEVANHKLEMANRISLGSYGSGRKLSFQGNGDPNYWHIHN
jgi:hypothetical protein